MSPRRDRTLAAWPPRAGRAFDVSLGANRHSGTGDGRSALLHGDEELVAEGCSEHAASRAQLEDEIAVTLSGKARGVRRTSVPPGRVARKIARRECRKATFGGDLGVNDAVDGAGEGELDVASAVSAGAAPRNRFDAVLRPRAHDDRPEVLGAVDASEAFDPEHAPRESSRALRRPAPDPRSVERLGGSGSEKRKPDDRHRQRRAASCRIRAAFPTHRSSTARFGASPGSVRRHRRGLLCIRPYRT
jgi:hypothetical protein